MISSLRKIYYLFKIGFSYLSKPKYGIKRGYIHRKNVVDFDDTSLKDEYQKEVYEYCASLYKTKNLKGVIDIGCGSGYKLIKNFENEPKAGVELKIEYLKKTYPKETWFEFADKSWKNFETDLLICSDVIEHVPNPDVFLIELASLTHINYWVFSTPDRSLDNSPWKYGPPNNEAHFREWSFDEFGLYMSNFFEVLEHKITNKEQRTQMVVCKKKSTHLS